MEAGKESESSKLGQRLGHMKDEAVQMGHKVKERMTVYKEGASEFMDGMSEYVKENPQKSALIAMGAGVGLGIIIGLLLRGRRD